MLWPIELPLQITFWLTVGVVVIFTIVLCRRKWRPLTAFLTTCAFGMLLFIPSCMITSALVDSVRFGVFEYESSKDIGDHRIWRSVPMSARKIAVQKYASGHRARFTVKRIELENWIDEIWQRSKQYSAYKREDIKDHVSQSSRSFENAFSELGWDLPSDLVVYDGPVAKNGASITFWFDTTTNTAYSRYSYW